jgi:predicted phage terminase large subunit-like protein
MTLRVPIGYVEGKAAQAAAEARESFWAFRKNLRYGTMLSGWWVELVAVELQQFYEDFAAGRRPKLALMAPPQHGKSGTAIDFIAWSSGKNPDIKTIFASYSAELGVRANLDLQRIFQSERYKRIFPLTRIGGIGTGWQCNNELIEFVGRRGSFRNTTVEGQITGMELHLGVIDDPVKGSAEAHSRVIRDRTWNWFVDDFCTRFAANGALLVIMTRWHLDDLLGRFIERIPGVRVLHFPAICERDDNYRRAGEPLFPELKPLDFLLEQQKLLTEGSWQALYQQSPIIIGGGIFPIEKLKPLPMFDRSRILKSVRYFDKGGTDSGGAFTAGVLMHALKDKTYVIEHVVRGQWSALEREEKIKFWAERDRANSRPGAYEVGVEQEPGSGGKESAENTIRNLRGFKVFADKVTGSKEVRAEPFAAQVQGGNVSMVAGIWQADLLDEMQSFPNGKYRDQVDACSGAFNRLVSGPIYNLFGGAFD